MVSVIVPVYNSEKYLEKCLESLLRQTYKNIEVIIIDDGSKDNSKKIIEKYILIDKRFHYFYQENSGASVARNFGIKNAVGKYLMFVDADDYLKETGIETLRNKIIRDNSDAVCFSHYKVYENQKVKEVFSWEDSTVYDKYFAIEKILKYEIKGYICDKFFKVDLWKKLKLSFEKNRYCEDWPVVTKYLGNSKRISFINDPIYFYVQHEESSIHTSNLKVISDYQYAVKCILEFPFIKYQNKNTILFFKLMSNLEIIHELENVSNLKKENIYKMSKKYNLPYLKINMSEVLIDRNINFILKIKYILWKIHLYSIVKKIIK